LLKVGEDSPAGCGSAQESSAERAYALSDAQAMTRGVRDAQSGTDTARGNLPRSTRKIQTVFMTSPRALAIASVIVCGTHSLPAQDLLGYRAYTLESTVAAVVAISGARDSDVKSLHERPAHIQRLDGSILHTYYEEPKGPIPSRTSSFVSITGRYIRSLSRPRAHGRSDQRRRHRIGVRNVRYSTASARGRPQRRGRRDGGGYDGRGALGRSVGAPDPYPWELPTAIPTHADLEGLEWTHRAGIKEAGRLDAKEAPQRELDQRTKQTADAGVASENARVANKAAFRP
jgi:hypothetical protein